MTKVLLGVNAFPATGDGGRRQAEALATWRALDGVRLANLGWPGDVFEVGQTIYAEIDTSQITVLN